MIETLLIGMVLKMDILENTFQDILNIQNEIDDVIERIKRLKVV